MTDATTSSASSSANIIEDIVRLIRPDQRVAVLRDPNNPSGTAQYGVIQAVSRLFGVEVNPANDTDAGEIERAISAFAQSPNRALIATATATSSAHHDLIVKLAERYKLPAVYADRLDG